MENATTEEKFHAAVELIKNLPKSGSIHPSNDLKLKFYSYYKQATEGPCELPKPGFWDIVNRAKWDAWNNLGNMSKEDAMSNYVEGFVQILKTTPLEDTNSIRDYVHLMGPYIEFAPKEIQEEHILVNGKVNKVLKNSEEKPNLANNKNQKSNREFSESEGHFVSTNVNGHNFNGSNESDSDEFSDTVDRVNESESENAVSDQLSSSSLEKNPVADIKGPTIVNVRGGGDNRISNRSSNSPSAGASGSRSHRTSRHARDADHSLQFPRNSINISGSGGGRRSGGNMTVDPSDVNEQIAMAVLRLQHTMEQVVIRLDSLESLLTQRKADSSALQVSNKKHSYWSFLGISPKAAIVILAWPFIVHWLMHLIRKRNRHL